MLFISYKEIDIRYGSVDNFLDWLLNCSAGCSFHCDRDGIWYRYDYDTFEYAVSNEGYCVSPSGLFATLKQKFVDKYFSKDTKCREWF